MDENRKKVILSARNLCKSYGKGDGVVHALKNVSLDVYDGELLVILGSSGSGKSTLLNMLGGMDQPDSGTILVGKRDLCKLDDLGLTRYRRHEIGFVFQSFNLIAELTARENVALTAAVSKNPNIIDDAFKMVDLEEKADSYPTQLSGGQQQRVSIARALAKDPRLLLCDEPTGALDYETGKHILKELEQLVRVYGKTAVVVTHTKEIGRMADRVIRMRSGEVIAREAVEHPISADEIDW